MASDIVLGAVNAWRRVYEALENDPDVTNARLAARKNNNFSAASNLIAGVKAKDARIADLETALRLILTRDNVAPYARMDAMKALGIDPVAALIRDQRP